MLISLQCDQSGLVPWFDEAQYFSERGVVNLGEDGMWVVAEYIGDKTWENLKDPNLLLSALDPYQVALTVPAFVAASTEFVISGTTTKGVSSLVVFLENIPVHIPVVDGVFTRSLSLTTPSEYRVVRVVDPSTGDSLSFNASSTISVML